MAFEPQDKFFITDVETLKVLADQRRIQLLELLGTKPYTVKELSAQLKVPPNKLDYHIRMMEDHGIITVVDEQVGPTQIVEKTYQSTAKHYLLDESMKPLATVEASIGLAFEAIESVKKELLQNTESILNPEVHQNTAEFGKGKLFLTREEAKQLAKELNDIWSRYDRNELGPEHEIYTLLVAMFATPNPSLIDDDE